VPAPCVKIEGQRESREGGKETENNKKVNKEVKEIKGKKGVYCFVIYCGYYTSSTCDSAKT